MPNFNNRSNNPAYRALEPGDRIKHDETKTTIRGYQVSISEDGKVTIDNKKLQSEEDWDEISLPAAVILKTAEMIRTTRRIERKKEGRK